MLTSDFAIGGNLAREREIVELPEELLSRHRGLVSGLGKNETEVEL